MIKPLICLPSPRDIPVFLEATAKLPYDKLWAKYVPEQEAYQLLRQHFLKMKEYTHFVILPDDLVVMPEAFDKLVADIEEHDYPVLSGYCLVNREQDIWKDKITVTHKPVSPLRTQREIEFLPLDYVTAMSNPKPIEQVAFSGFPLMFIRRDIVEQIQFEDDRYYNKWPIRGGAMDITFCWECRKREIPIYVDYEVFADHLAYGRQVEFGVGVKRPYIQFNDQEPTYVNLEQSAPDETLVYMRSMAADNNVVVTKHGFVMNMVKAAELHPEMLEWYGRHFKRNWNVVEVHAGTGYHTLLAAHIASHGDIYAFEPDSEKFALLRENTLFRNDFYDNIHLMPKYEPLDKYFKPGQVVNLLEISKGEREIKHILNDAKRLIDENRNTLNIIMETDRPPFALPSDVMKSLGKCTITGVDSNHVLINPMS